MGKYNIVSQMTKGAVTTPLSAITATTTSGAINCTGFSAVLVEVILTGTGTFKLDLQGSLSGSTAYVYVRDSDGVTVTSGNVTASNMFIFRGLPDFIKLVATEVDGSATITVNVQSINA